MTLIVSSIGFCSYSSTFGFGVYYFIGTISKMVMIMCRWIIKYLIIIIMSIINEFRLQLNVINIDVNGARLSFIKMKAQMSQKLHIR